MDICHLKNSKFGPKFLKIQGRVVIRGDIAKDDSGSYAVFSEQGSLLQDYQDTQDKQQMQYQLTYTQVKMENAPKLLKIPKSECPDIWIRPPRHKWPKSWSSMEDPVVPLERNLYGHPLAGLLWEREFVKVLLKYGWEKVPNWKCSSFIVKKEYYYLCTGAREF